MQSIINLKIIILIVGFTHTVLTQKYDSIKNVLRESHKRLNMSYLLYSKTYQMNTSLNLEKYNWESLKGEEANDFFLFQSGVTLDKKINSCYQKAKSDFFVAQTTLESIVEGIYDSSFQQSAIQRIHSTPNYITLGLNYTLMALYSSIQLREASQDAQNTTNITDMERAQYNEVKMEAEEQLDLIYDQIELWSIFAAKIEQIQYTLSNFTTQSEFAFSAIMKACESIISLRMAIDSLNSSSKQANDNALWIAFTALDDIFKAENLFLQRYYTYEKLKILIDNFEINMGVISWIDSTLSEYKDELKQVSEQKDETLELVNLIKLDQIGVRKRLPFEFSKFNEDNKLNLILEDFSLLKIVIHLNESIKTAKHNPYQQKLNETVSEQDNSFIYQLIEDEVEKRVSEEKALLLLREVNKDIQIEKLQQQVEKHLESLNICEADRKQNENNLGKLQLQLSKVVNKILPKINISQWYTTSFEADTDQNELKKKKKIMIDTLPTSLQDKFLDLLEKSKKQEDVSNFMIENISFCSIDDSTVIYGKVKEIVEGSTQILKEAKEQVIIEIQLASTLLKSTLKQIQCFAKLDTSILQFEVEDNNDFFCKNLNEGYVIRNIINRKTAIRLIQTLVNYVNQKYELVQQYSYPNNKSEVLNQDFINYLSSLLKDLMDTKTSLLKSNSRTCLFELFSDSLWKIYNKSDLL